MREKKPINVRIYYPETEEGNNNLIHSQVTVMLDILENQIGIEKTNILIDMLRTNNND